MMESKQLSLLSSLRAESKPEDYIQPHYKEAYRLAIDSLVRGGSDSYHEFLKGERLSSFLSKEELLFITANAEEPVIGNHTEETDGSPDSKSSSGTYWPVHSDVETPDLELGWPEYVPQRLQTNIDLLFHPPRLNSPTIKEVIRKHMQDSRQLIAIVMDTFTDVDIFKEAVDASLRGVSVYVLLDDVHIQSFISMAESQDIHFQKLRNMRIRTVKGHEYLCRSGAKFHGSMEQKFLLVDCETVIYGSYSYMWSFEKIHLSMVQVIKGQLVGSYDEEFRTLYARSSVPAMLCPPEGVADAGRTNGRRGVAKYASPAGQVFDRKDQLRHTLDTVYKKACERQLGVREAEERLYEEELFDQQSAALFNTGPVNVQSHIKNFQPAETVNFLKRHSYAGERKEPSYVPQNIHFGASHWNVAGDEGYHNGRIRCSNDVGDHTQHQQQGNHMFRGHNIRQSYHGNDKQILMMKQNMPTYENTSKSFLRTWRIDSYLNNNDPPIGEYSDYLDQYEPPLESKAAPYMSSRLRSSLVFKSTIPEQPENNYYTNNSLHSSGQMDSANTPNTHQPHQALYHCSMENPSERVMDNRARLEEFQNKRKSLQILDDPRGNVGFNPMRGSHHSIYGSLNRAKGGTQIRNTDIFQNNWHKRHSVADPRFNTENRDHRESSSHMYGFSRNQAERGMPGNNLQNEGYSSNLNEDQRSVSHYDVKSVTDTKSQPALKWQEPPSRTVSAAALDVNTKETTNHTSPHFLKTSSKKIRSLLNIPEKKESTSLLKGSRSSRAGCSSDTLTDREELGSDRDRERGTQRNSTNSTKSPSELFVNRNHFGEDIGSSSAPRFSTEEIVDTPADSTPSMGTQQQQQQQQTSIEKRDKSSLKSGEWRLRNQKVDGRLYSRFEPFCAFDKKQSPPTHQASVSANTHTQEQPKNIVLSKGRSASEQQNHHGQPTHGHHENKLGKFIQRVGNLINKNK